MKDKALSTFNGIESIVNDNKLQLNGVSSSNDWILNGYIELGVFLPRTYTISIYKTGVIEGAYAIDNQKTQKRYFSKTFPSNSTQIIETITVEETTGLLLRIWSSPNLTYNGTITVQITEGSTAPTSYTPHAHQTYIIPTQQPMRKISDYADTFVRENGQWYEKHVINRLILTGEESFENTYGESLFNLSNALSNNPFIVGYGLSNYFIYNVVQSSINNNLVHGEFALQYASYSQTYNLFIKNTDFTSATNFKMWLAEQYANGTPVYVDYVLQEPLLLSCTPEQITALEKMYNEAKTYKDGTYIYSTDAVSPYFKVEYYQDISKEIAEIQQAIIELGGII